MMIYFSILFNRALNSARICQDTEVSAIKDTEISPKSNNLSFTIHINWTDGCK